MTAQRYRYRFGLFQVDARVGELRRDGVKLKIQEQPFQVLVKLLECPGDLVTRDELRAVLWSSETFVDFETGLNTAIMRLREVLGDSADQPRFIETLPRRGYRFIASLEAAAQTEKEERSTSPLVRGRSWRVVIAAAFVVLAAVAAIEVRHLRTSIAPPLEIKRITTTGNVRHAAISYDGRYLAYVTIEKDRKPALWLEHLPSGTRAQLLAHGPWDDILPRFSRDNNSVYLFMRLPDVEEGELDILPILGGAPRKLFDGVLSTASVSPDEKWLAFVRVVPGHGNRLRDTELVIAATEGSVVRTIATRGWQGFYGPGSWSPDGSRVAIPVADSKGGSYLGIFPIAGGSEQILTAADFGGIGFPVWTTDGRGLTFSAIPSSGSSPGSAPLYEISFPGGQIRQLTHDREAYDDVSVSGDGHSLVAVRLGELSGIWVAPFDAPDSASPITPIPNHAGIVSVVWNGPDKIIYEGNATAAWEIIEMAPDGSGSRVLPLEPGIRALYSAAPDGRTLVFCVIENGRWRIWRSRIDGSNARFITVGGEAEPQCTPDGKWVVYVKPFGADWQVFKVPIEGGPAVQVSPLPLDAPIVSPDGRSLAALLVDSAHSDREHAKVAILDFATGNLIKTLDAHPRFDGLVWHWTKDGRALLYRAESNGLANLWLLPLNGEPPRQLTHFTSDGMRWFDVSPDGRRLVMARSTPTSDAVLLTNFR